MLLIDKDHESVYSQVLEKEPSIDKELLMRDMIIFYFAGHDTSSHAISSLVYFTKKYSEIYQKVFKEIFTGLGIKDRSDVKSLINSEKLDLMDYLNYVIKETLRYDNPATISLGYKSLEPVRICGVPLPRDAKIFLSIHANHYNPKQWQEPDRFLPERFDPESTYFKCPELGDSEHRSPYAFVPFSFGLRNCAGKSLALLEIKTVAAYMFMKFDYELDPKQTNNEYIRFGGATQFKMKVKITKKY